MPRLRASKISMLCSKFEKGLDAPKNKYGDKLVIPVPNIIFRQQANFIILQASITNEIDLSTLSSYIQSMLQRIRMYYL